MIEFFLIWSKKCWNLLCTIFREPFLFSRNSSILVLSDHFFALMNFLMGEISKLQLEQQTSKLKFQKIQLRGCSYINTFLVMCSEGFSTSISKHIAFCLNYFLPPWAALCLQYRVREWLLKTFFFKDFMHWGTLLDYSITVIRHIIITNYTYSL